MGCIFIVFTIGVQLYLNLYPGARGARVGARHDNKTRCHTTSPVRPLHAECLRLRTLLTQKWGE